MRPPWPHLLFSIFLALFITTLPVTAFESLVQAQGEVRKDLPAKPLRFASPDWSIYHRTVHLHRHITNLSRNCHRAHVTAKIAVPGESLSAGGALSPDRHIDPDLDDPDTPLGLSSASDGLLYLTVRSLHPTDNSSPARKFADGLLRRSHTEHNTRIMFVFGEEGRDLLTAEIALRVLRDVCSQATTNATTNHNQSHHQLKLKEGVELVLVPILNPDGRRISEMGRRCDRTNANDVDVDRNWPSFWGESGGPAVIPDATNEMAKKRGQILRDAVARRVVSGMEPLRYTSSSRGTHPFSEPETRSLRAIVDKMRPTSYVSVRTGAVALTVPWDCKPALLPDAQRAKLLRVTGTITAAHCTRCKTGNLWNVTGRVKCGTGTDYMYGTLQVPFVHTWHVYDVPAPRGDCFRRHNPVSKAAYDRVTENWANAVFNFSNAVFNWVTLESSEGVHVAEKNASLSAAHASVERAEALARGVPDPERDELEKSSFHGILTSGSAQQKTVHATEQRVQKGKAQFFRVFRDQNNKAFNTADISKAKHEVGPAFPERPAYVTEDTGASVLTGWCGVWTAFFLMGAGFFIAKRYVFRQGTRRPRFLSHPAVKHA